MGFLRRWLHVRRGRRRRLRAAVLLSLIPGFAGVVFVVWPLTAGLERAGLDFLFQLRGTRPVPPEVCVVAIDDDSFWIRELDPGGHWPRALHAELIRILNREGARAVAFDVLFDYERDPVEDVDLEFAMAEAGNVVLASTVELIEDPRFRQARLLEPIPPLAEAAAAVGDVNLPRDRDGVIREAWLMHGDRPSLALAAYEVATGDLSKREQGTRLIDYYGPTRTVPTRSMYQALEPETYLPPGFFRDKIVFVGRSQPAAAAANEEKDSFLTPFGREGQETYGVEIHATLTANLLEGRRIDPLSPLWQAVMLLLLPLPAALAFIYLRPLVGAFVLVVLELLPWTAAYLAFTGSQLWLPAVAPSVVQLPMAYVVSLVWYYLTTAREREKIRKAFSFYLSPDMIRRITESPESLNLGGEEIVATAMFTDIKGFTSIAESMTAPQTASLLNDYFSEATRHVFETGGTLIKYIGDAVFAIWGAPLRMDDHADKACVAAIAMARLQDSMDGPAGKLVTRIGVHTGPMLVGNLGSSQRFDYTAIGDAVNLAARLEGLNKKFGTRALASGDTISRTDGAFVVRRLGRVRVVGRAEPVDIFELIGQAGESGLPDGGTIARFEGAVDDFCARRFDRAREGFREVLAGREGSDGPSEFYLDAIAEFVETPPPAGWTGVITFETK